jgi:hypothetical protein
MQHLMLRLARRAVSVSFVRGIRRLLAVAALVVPLHACTEAPQTRTVAHENPDEGSEVAAGTTSTELTSRLSALEQRYGAAVVEGMLEALPALAPHFDTDGIDTGRAAALQHWAALSGEERAAFAACLEPTLDYAARIESLTSALPNGYHDVAFSLPASKPLYVAVLERYGLDADTATSYDVASSLSTFDDAALRFAIAERLCRMTERERADYLDRLASPAGSEGR